MVVKNLTDEYAPMHERIASQAFDISLDPDKADKLPAEYMPGAFDENGTLLADMEICDKECFFGNGILRCAGIGGVASKPEYRNKGAVRAIFNKIFDGSLYGDKWDISILYPFSDTYYAKFGYASVGMKCTAAFPIERLRGIERCNDVFLYEGEDSGKLIELYNKCASKYGLSFKRNCAENFPGKPYEARTFTYIHADKNGEYKSYITFSVNRGIRKLTVTELLASDSEGYLSVLGFLRNYDGAMNTVEFTNMSGYEPLLNFVIDKNKIERTSSYAGSVRILNLENVLKAKKYKCDNASAVISVNDTVKSNCGTFKITVKNGVSSVAVTDEQPDIILDAVAEAKVIFDGIDDIEELDYIPGVQLINNNPDLEKIFGKNKILLCDGF